MKKFKIILFFILAVIFVVIPLPASDVIVRVHFWEGDVTNGSLYYSTTDLFGFNGEQCIHSEFNEETGDLTFKLEGDLEDDLSGLRLDVPYSETLLGIDSITISSAGIIQKRIDPCEFLAEENRLVVNDIEAISLIESREKVYIATSGADPYIVLSEEIVEQVRDGYSHYVLTRIGICIFAFGVWFVAKKKFFV